MLERIKTIIENLKENSKGSQFVIVAVTVLLLVAGWGNVIFQYISIEDAIIKSFQEAQLEIVRSAALATKEYADDQFNNRGRSLTDIETVEVEIKEKFIQPISLLGEGNTAWIIGSKSTMVFDESVDFDYRDMSIEHFLPLQHYYCQASSFEEMQRAVLRGEEGVSKYIWVKPRMNLLFNEAVITKWEKQCGTDAQFLWSIEEGLEQGWEIAAWTPVAVTGNNTWVIGMTTKLTDIRKETGAAKSVFFSVLMMSFVTIVVVAFVFYSLRSRRQVVQLQQQVVDLQIKIDNVEKARQVESIVDTDYFKGLRDQAKTLRQGSRRRRAPVKNRRDK